MFWDRYIPEKYLAKQEVCALEVCDREEGRVYYYTCLRRKANKLDLLSTGTSHDQLVLPPGIARNKVPIQVIMNGRGVVVRKVQLSESGDQELPEIIQQHLPAINPDDFYIQLYRQEDHSAFIALCRREQVDRLLAALTEQKQEVAGVLLGVPAVIGLSPLWEPFNSLPSSLHRIELSNALADVFTDSDQPPETVKIDDLSFSSLYTLGMAGGLSYLLQRPLVQDHSETLSRLVTRHREKNKFRLMLMLTVGLAFLLALVNVGFYTSYYDQNNKLETELSIYQGKYEQVNKLLDDYQKNRELIENAGVLGGNRLSEFADRIGATLPDEVLLTDLYFNPRKENDDPADSLIVFQNKSLILKGNCPKSFIVNEWINVLKMQKFVRQVSLEKFVYNNQGILPNFEIRLITE